MKALAIAESSELKAKIYLELGSYDRKYYELATRVNPNYVRNNARGQYSPDEKRKKIIPIPVGWAGHPEDIEEKPFDYFYMQSYGRASEKAIQKRSGAMMQTTCTDAATTKVKGELIGKFVKESYGSGIAGCSDGESSGAVVVREFGGKLGGVNVMLCRPRSKEDPGIPYSDWKKCSCIVYVKIEGGREAIRKSILEADKRK